MVERRRGGERFIAQANADAVRELEKAADNDPSPLTPRGLNRRVRPGKQSSENPEGWIPDFKTGLPADPGCECPVIPLGIEGGTMHLLDSNGQYVAPTRFLHEDIQKLFAAVPNYPKWAWPRYGKPLPALKDGDPPRPNITSFHDDSVRDALFFACSRLGQFSARDRLRGRGAWRLRGRQLLYHAGDGLWVAEGQGNLARLKRYDTGMIDNMLYPGLPPLPAPWEGPYDARSNPAIAIVRGLQRFNWERPAIDPVLFLGWLGVAFLGGALDWRSAVFLVGDKGTGKSTLQDALKLIFGPALFHAVDTSAAGIHQDMGLESRPIAVDEFGGSSDTRKLASVMELARSASSGGFVRRGSAGHEAVSFQMHSAFLFSAINLPPLRPEDYSRMAILRLRELPPDRPAVPPLQDSDETWGRLMLRQLMQEWPRFPAVFEAYRGALASGGHVDRGQDTYGTLLACADMLLGVAGADELGIPLSEDLGYWQRALAADVLPEIEDARPNWRACLEHLLTAPVDIWRGGHASTIGRKFAELVEDPARYQNIRGELELAGVTVLPPQDVGFKDEAAGFILAVPNQSPALAKMFNGTPWGGFPDTGAWKEALRQAPRDVVITDKQFNRVMISSVRCRCTLVVMSKFHLAPERG
jgi:hypothetical protein